jgi:hypothetical protein
MQPHQTLIEGQLWTIPNFLSPEQSKYYRDYIDHRQQVFTGCQPQPKRWQEQLNDPKLCQEFWDLLKPYFTTIPTLAQYQRKHTPDLKRPHKVSQYIPAVKYQVDGISTVIHQDFRRDPTEEFGVIIYLNQEFPDGRTIYYDYRKDPTATIHPQTGLAVIFDIDLFHQGIAPGHIKYIICPRVCYTPINPTQPKPILGPRPSQPTANKPKANKPKANKSKAKKTKGPVNRGKTKPRRK